MIITALLLPAVVGLFLMVGRAKVSGPVAAGVGAAVMTASLVLYALVWEGEGVVSGEVDTSWIEPLGARLHLGVTFVSWPFLLMTAFIGVLCCLWLVAEDTSPALVGLVLVISASSMGVFSSLDLLLFFIFFELALIPMWFVIAWWGDSDYSSGPDDSRRSGPKNGARDGARSAVTDGAGARAETADKAGARLAATRFLLFTVAGSALLLVGIVIIGLDGGLQVGETVTGSLAAAVLVCAGFAVKTPVVPLHTWLPDAHSKAPTVGSVLLAAVFLKLGTYGLILFAPLMSRFSDVAPYLALAGVIGIVWSALACYAQDDLKRMIAYSSIGHMGFVVLAISTQSAAGLAAAVFGSVAHGLITGLLFFTAGSLKDRFATASLSRIGRGLYARTPWLAVTFVFAAVASLGLPGLAGFWGELLSLRAAYELDGVLTKPVAWSALAVALLGIALTTAYFVRAIRLLAQGEPEPQDTDRDLGRREVVVLGTLAVAVVVLGVWPDPLLDLFDTVTRSYAR